MSTVSNPYTFNIKSNCGFSTDTLLSNNIHQVKITMKYSETTYEIDHPADEQFYYTDHVLFYNSNTGNMVPNIVNGNSIIYVNCDYTDGFYEQFPNVTIGIKSSKQYSKIILNGGPIKNCSLKCIRQDNDINIYKSALNNYDLEKYDNVTFDLTIKFVE